jgi:hypothetical protein
MTLNAQKRRTPDGAKAAAKGITREARARAVAERSQSSLSTSLPHVESDSQLVELFDQVWALTLSVAAQSQELIQLKGCLDADPRSVEAFLQARRQALLKYDLLALVGEAWELKRLEIIRRNTIASLKGGPETSDIYRDRIQASMSSEDRVEAFFDKRRLTPSNDASDEMPVYLVHSLAELLWRRINGNIPASGPAGIAWLVLPGYEQRQWLGRAAVATMEAERSRIPSLPDLA